MRPLPLPLLKRLVPLNGLNESSLQALLEQGDCRLVGRGQRVLVGAELEQSHTWLLSGEVSMSSVQGVAVHTAETPFPLGYGMRGLQSAVAITDCVCFSLPRNILERQLSWDHVAAAIELELSYLQEQDEELSWRLTLLKSNLFLKVPPLNIRHVYGRLRAMQVRKGDVILRQGESGDGCYFIRRGRAAVTRRFPGEEHERHVVDIGHGRCFGEDALIHDTVRNATVTMISDGLLMRLDKPDFMLLLREPEVGSLRGSDLEQAIAAGAVLLDVRLPEEFGVARLDHADNAPLSCLPLLLATRYRTQHEYLVYCDTGQRAKAAASLMQLQGYQARYLSEGLSGMASDLRQRLVDEVPPVVPVPSALTLSA